MSRDHIKSGLFQWEIEIITNSSIFRPIYRFYVEIISNTAKIEY